jgi:3'-phosphoadenosine 5'-phosphosulfate sulfotransferase (PAPS reductase)/FAD synthetase
MMRHNHLRRRYGSNLEMHLRFALDNVERFAERLGVHLDVDRAVRLLGDPDFETNEYRRQLRAQKRAYERSTSWRITAPLRRTRLLLFGAPRRTSMIGRN